MTSRTKYLPKTGHFQVDETKVLNYLLSDKHPEGKSKAKYFRGCGFARDEWQSLQSALAEHGDSRPIVSTEKTVFGVKYVVECALTTPDGGNRCIRSVWVSEATNTFRLITAYPVAP